MNRSTVSTCHSLKIIPLARLSRFARIQSRVIIMLLGEAIDAEAVPGTVKISTTTDNGKLKKKITFERSDVSESVADTLEGYKVSRLVAVYIDESGKQRVSGSPDWPLTLDYITEGGVFIVTLQGEDVHPDGFLAD
ncbi:MAG: hypothetical protein OSJ46_06120 [Duncaniella sp.]|nr:hypothetical protein [Duncaniella sp.]